MMVCEWPSACAQSTNMSNSKCGCAFSKSSDCSRASVRSCKLSYDADCRAADVKFGSISRILARVRNAPGAALRGMPQNGHLTRQWRLILGRAPKKEIHQLRPVRFARTTYPRGPIFLACRSLSSESSRKRYFESRASAWRILDPNLTPQLRDQLPGDHQTKPCARPAFSLAPEGFKITSRSPGGLAPPHWRDRGRQQMSPLSPLTSHSLEAI